MDPNFIISPVVGAAIGGFANWLAIQMLFFPLTERRLFGVRIPFTPGLIPKERKRIAQSVANTVANYFLSEDVIVNAVVSPHAEQQFKQYMRDVINKKKESKQTLGVLFESITGRNILVIYEENEEKVLDFIEEQIKSPSFAESSANIIENELDRLFEKSLLELTDETVNEKLEEKISRVLKSEILNDFIGDITTSQLQALLKSKNELGEILPKGMIDYIKAKSVANSDKVAEMIVEFITSSSVQFKMRKFLKNSFESSFKLRMLSKVMDVDKVFENILEEVVIFLEQHESRREIANFLLKTIESMEVRKIDELSESYGIDIDDKKIKHFLKTLISAMGSKENVFGLVESSGILDWSIKKIIESLDVSIIENKGQLIRKVIVSAQKTLSVKEIIKPILREKIEELSRVEAAKMLGYLGDEDISLIEEAVVTNFKRLISGESDRIIKVIDVSKIVEDKINAFDVGEMEEIMLGVIKKDIVVMRVFEAGIGFIIGFFVPLFPYILKLFK